MLGSFAVALGWIFVVGFQQASQELRRTIPVKLTDWAMRNLYEINSNMSAAAITPHIPALKRETTVTTADDVLEFEHLSRDVISWYPTRADVPLVADVMSAATLRDHVRFIGKIDIIHRSAKDKVIVVGARDLVLDDETELVIGQSNLVLVAEKLTVGKGSKIIAFPRNQTTRYTDNPNQALAAGNFTLVVTDELVGPPLEVDLRGADGSNGMSGANGKDGVAPKEVRLASREAYGVNINVGKPAGVGKLKWDIDQFRKSPLGAKCDSDCQATVQQLLDWADACQKTGGCPKYEFPVCLYTPPPLVLSDVSAGQGGGENGSDGTGGQNGGDGGMVKVFLSRSVADVEPIVLTPKPGKLSDGGRTQEGAASGGVGGAKGIGGRSTPIDSIVDVNESGGCFTKETSTPFRPSRDGQVGPAGNAGRPHSYAGHPSRFTF
ncbi:hypothetical protein [Mesorhizobium sp. ANAO-SY3R2]|uniref:hypothetical protein n=1 Tax=Mesorhizobium sp. ANAO-SY3R2 TaxID=3166644 RepID=UPI00366BB8C9